MTEIEIKLNLSSAEMALLIKGADFVGQVVNHDIYYDTADMQLAGKHIWLRQRNGKWELKLRLIKRDEHECRAEQHKEVSDPEQIKKYLGLIIKKCSLDICGDGQLQPVAEYIVTRRKYKHGHFNIDIDATDFGYNMVEVELMKPDGETYSAAENDLWTFVESQGIIVKQQLNVIDKLDEYWRVKRPEIFEKVKKLQSVSL